jgi:tungstate transport system permease protein
MKALIWSWLQRQRLTFLGADRLIKLVRERSGRPPHKTRSECPEMPLLNMDICSILWLSIRVSGTAVLLSSLVGIPCGVWLGLSGHPRKRYLSAIIQTGMALPPVVVGLILYILLSRSGPLAFLGWLFTPNAMIAAQTILALPFVIGITMSAVAAVPAELTSQLRTLVANDRQCRRTILREARHGVGVAVAAAFGRSISEVGAVLIVGGNVQGQTRVLTTAIVLETGKGDFGYALALGGALLLLALSVNLLIVRLQGGRPLV